MLVKYEDDETILEIHVNATITETELVALITDAKERISAPKRHDALTLVPGKVRTPKAAKAILNDVVEFETIPQTVGLFFETLKNASTSAWLLRQMIDTSPQMTAVMSRLKIIS